MTFIAGLHEWKLGPWGAFWMDAPLKPRCGISAGEPQTAAVSQEVLYCCESCLCPSFFCTSITVHWTTWRMLEQLCFGIMYWNLFLVKLFLSCAMLFIMGFLFSLAKVCPFLWGILYFWTVIHIIWDLILAHTIHICQREEWEVMLKICCFHNIQMCLDFLSSVHCGDISVPFYFSFALCASQLSNKRDKPRLSPSY